MVKVDVQYQEITRLDAAFGELPAKMQNQVLGRALGRSKQKVLRTYAQLASKRQSIAQKHIVERMSARVSGGVLTIRIRSNNIPVYKLGARQAAAGVYVTKRGLYKRAFIAQMPSGHRGVFIRDRGDGPSGRVPRTVIHEVHGPNPAGEIIRNPGVYEDMLRETFDREFMKQIEQGVVGMLKMLAAK